MSVKRFLGFKSANSRFSLRLKRVLKRMFCNLEIFTIPLDLSSGSGVRGKRQRCREKNGAGVKFLHLSKPFGSNPRDSGNTLYVPCLEMTIYLSILYGNALI